MACWGFDQLGPGSVVKSEVASPSTRLKKKKPQVNESLRAQSWRNGVIHTLDTTVPKPADRSLTVWGLADC